MASKAPAARSYGKIKAKNVVRDAATGIRGFRVSNANLRRNRDQQARVANAVTMLVGAVQDLMKLSGQSMAQALHKTIVIRGGNKINVPLMLGVRGLPRVGRVIAKGGTWAASAAITIAGIPVFFVSKLLDIFLIKPYGLQALDEVKLATIIRRTTKTLAALVKGKDTDLRPLVSSVVMILDPVDALNLARDVLTNVLKTYVYSPYESAAASGPGAMCELCKAAESCKGGPKKAMAGGMARNGRKLRGIVDKVLRAVNILLAVDGRKVTVSAIIYAAMRSNLPTFMQSGPVRAAGGAAAGLAAPPLAAALAPWASRYASKMGVGIDAAALSGAMIKHWAKLAGWLSTGRGNIEPFILDVVEAVRPMGLVRGAASVLVANQGATSEFCAFCSTGYKSCTR